MLIRYFHTIRTNQCHLYEKYLLCYQKNTVAKTNLRFHRLSRAKLQTSGGAHSCGNKSNVFCCLNHMAPLRPSRNRCADGASQHLTYGGEAIVGAPQLNRRRRYRHSEQTLVRSRDRVPALYCKESSLPRSRRRRSRISADAGCQITTFFFYILVRRKV
jgi:hypothetical protein